MANEILDKFNTVTNVTLTTTALTSANGQISAKVDNTTTRAGRMKVYWRIKTATAPTAGEVYKLYLIEEDNHATEFVSAGLTLGDADVTAEPTSARLIDLITLTASGTTFFYGQTTVHDLPPTFGFVLWNASSQTASSTDTDCFVHYQLVTDEVQ
jgi:hypothetical protein